MNLAQLLIRSAQVYPDAPAVFHGTKLICTYRELAGRAARIAGYLGGQLSLKPGDRVALFMTNMPEYLELLYGIWQAGLVAVPINAKLHAREAEFILRDSGASGLFVSPDLSVDLLNDLLGESGTQSQVKLLRASIVAGSAEYGKLLTYDPLPAMVSRSSNDLAWLFYTSGTTGRPKGVMQTHGNLMAMTMCY